MSRDRLAELRSNSRPTVTESHELSHLPSGHGAELGQREFLSEISSIQEGVTRYSANIQEISSLNSRKLGAATADSDTSRLDQLQHDTMKLSDELKDRIRRLTEGDMTKLNKAELQMRKDQIKLVTSNFKEALQLYQRTEVEYRTKSKQRIERQFRIVKPDASPEEVRQVVDNGQTQAFADALSRVGQSQMAYSEVKQRHQELQRLEQTLAELAQTFNDMAYTIEQQDELFTNLENTTAEVQNNTEKGLEATNVAVKHARSYRKGRKICFGVTVVLIIVIILAVVLGVCVGGNGCGRR